MLMLLRESGLDFIFAQQHVGDAIQDWEHSTGFRANQLTLNHIDLDDDEIEEYETSMRRVLCSQVRSFVRSRVRTFMSAW